MAVITVRGARTHNLQDVTVEIPRDALVVITGPSGSGKSSLAFSTLHAEGQRRYIEALGVAARRSVGHLPRPPVDSIEGLTPTVAVAQAPPPATARATVGTLTEIDDYLRLLMARVGQARCPRCGAEVRATHPAEIVAEVLGLGEGRRLSILAPVVRGAVGDHRGPWLAWRKEGFVRARVDGVDRDLGDDLALDPREPHDIDLVIDRVVVKDGVRPRISEAVELAMRQAAGVVRIVPVEGEPWLRSDRFVCVQCGTALPSPEPALFSANSVKGACPECRGLGSRQLSRETEVAIERGKSIRSGALAALLGKKVPEAWSVRAVEAGVDLDRPWDELPPESREWVLLGDDDAPGLLDASARTAAAKAKDEPEDGVADLRWEATIPCRRCGGARLRPEALAFMIEGRSIAALAALSVGALGGFLRGLHFAGALAPVATTLRAEALGRLGYLERAGLDYVALDRPARTLSNGEFQRARLAGQLGGGLSGVTYVLDEPTLGLHPRDADRLMAAIRDLLARGNAVVMVEHDLDVIAGSDHVIDMGPGAGVRGGQIVAVGAPNTLPGNPASVTGPWMTAATRPVRPRSRHTPSGTLTLRGATLHTLKDITVSIPLGCLSVITGVSGSGKSSLILGTLAPWLRSKIEGTPPPSIPLRGLDGSSPLERVVIVDARPLGRTPRSVPASAVGLMSELRSLFAAMPEAKARGFNAARFSFNLKGGRCERCQGAGVIRVGMDFLPDVSLPCDLCDGARYEPETLQVKFRGWSIADLLGMTVDQAIPVLEAIPRARDLLFGLRDVGLGYLRLGQSVTTLSGGEAQRVRLATELSRRGRLRTMYLLDEPTAGLHAIDVDVLLTLLERLVDEGNTVVCVEHHLDVIARADHVIELGPDGGEAGGRVIAAGAPEVLAGLDTPTAPFLARRMGIVRGA